MNANKREPAPRVKTQEQLQDVQARQEGKSTTELLRQACRDASASVDIGEDTNTRLGKQGEQMEGMSRTLDNIEYELKVSDRIVKGMSSWGGMVASWFTSAPKAPKEKDSVRSKHATSTSDGHRGRSTPDTQPRSAKGARGNATGQRIEDALQQEKEAQRDQRTEDDMLLDALSNDLAIMKGQATTQRDVLVLQNKQLDEIEKKNDKVTQHMKSTDRKVRHML